MLHNYKTSGDYMDSLNIENTNKEENIFKLLELSGIDTSFWGITTGKTKEDFLRYISTGEYRLTEIDGHYINNVRCLDILVEYEDKVLTEDSIVYTSGQKGGTRKDIRSLGEKLHPMEEPAISSVLRALQEELKISAVCVETIIFEKEDLRTKESPSFPGLLTNYSWFQFKVILNDYGYNSEGYTEVQKGKTTYFKWK